MFEVNGIPILVDEVEILRTLRDQVEQRTGKQILHKIKKSGDNIMICCPQHNDGQERRPSCGITVVRHGDKPPGTVHCFACGYIDSLEGMISKCFGYSDSSYGKNWLINNFLSPSDFKKRKLFNNLSLLTRETAVKKRASYVSEEELASYRFTHSYVYQRRLTDDIIEKYDIGYQKDFQFESIDSNGVKHLWPPTEVITFPVRDEKGNCLFVSRRSIYGKTFFLPPDIDKPVYGIYELPRNCKEVIICESVFNALTCVVYGRPAVALFGTGKASQYETLKKLPIRKYILALDPDEAGERGEEKLKKALSNKLLSKLVIPQGKDINDLTKEEFDNLVELKVF